jgi:CRISPR/Cas system type I-B associated protein Csh2 (Cas7 group RAMP superfamily)
MSYINDPKDKGLFKNPKYKKYNEIVSFDDVERAKHSIIQLEEELKTAKTKRKALRVARVIQYSSNRALASTKNTKLTKGRISELSKIGNEYKSSAKESWDYYNANKSKLK